MSVKVDDKIAPGDAPNVVNEDITCTQCGYNLRTLARDSLCPECSQPVQDSAPGRSHRIPESERLSAVVRMVITTGLPMAAAPLASLVAGLAFRLWRTERIGSAIRLHVIVALANPVFAVIMAYFDLLKDRICIGEEVVINRNPLSKVVRVRRNEVVSIGESQTFGLLIRTKGFLKGFGVPPEIEGYEEIRHALARWRPIERCSVRLKISIAAFVGLGCFMFSGASASYGRTPAIVISGNLMLATMSIVLIFFIRQSQIRQRLKVIYMIILALLILICLRAAFARL